MITQKGSYSNFFAVIAVFTGIAILLFSGNAGVFEPNNLEQTAIMQSKRQAQNGVLVVDKVIADAMGDSVGSDCLENQALIITTIRSYIALADAQFEQCTIPTPTVTKTGGLYSIPLSVICTQSVPEQLDVVYTLSPTFSRSIVLTPGASCQIQVFDGTTLELDKTRA
jgi:hypothetical protein